MWSSKVSMVQGWGKIGGQGSVTKLLDSVVGRCCEWWSDMVVCGRSDTGPSGNIVIEA